VGAWRVTLPQNETPDFLKVDVIGVNERGLCEVVVAAGEGVQATAGLTYSGAQPLVLYDWHRGQEHRAIIQMPRECVLFSCIRQTNGTPYRRVIHSLWPVPETRIERLFEFSLVGLWTWQELALHRDTRDALLEVISLTAGEALELPTEEYFRGRRVRGAAYAGEVFPVRRNAYWKDAVFHQVFQVVHQTAYITWRTDAEGNLMERKLYLCN